MIVARASTVTGSNALRMNGIPAIEKIRLKRQQLQCCDIEGHGGGQKQRALDPPCCCGHRQESATTPVRRRPKAESPNKIAMKSKRCRGQKGQQARRRA